MTKSILVVDDNSAVRHSLRRIFEGHSGWQVCGEAVDGVDAVEKARQLTPDLIVLDLAMPRMNGLEAARALRSFMPRVPLILFTVFGNTPQTTKEAREVGITNVVSKADGAEGLVSTIQAAFDRPN